MREGADFQTPPAVCEFMAGLIPEGVITILEPTPGAGNLVRAIESKGRYQVTAPENYFTLDKAARFDCIVMNPPFSAKTAYGVPEGYEKPGMRLGYSILQECMQRSNHVIALMPWFTITDSDVRLRAIQEYGLKSLTALPRKTFGYTRIQTVVFELEKGYSGSTIFNSIQL